MLKPLYCITNEVRRSLYCRTTTNSRPLFNTTTTLCSRTKSLTNDQIILYALQNKHVLDVLQYTVDALVPKYTDTNVYTKSRLVILINIETSTHYVNTSVLHTHNMH